MYSMNQKHYIQTTATAVIRMNAMNATKFVDKDNQSLWTKELADGKTINSVCVEVTDTTLDLETLFERTEKLLVWIKSEDQASLLKTQDSVIAQINAGVLKPYRKFSKTPFYNGQEQDVNPSTGASLGRYSEVKLCPAAKHAELHRQYVVLEEPTVATAKTEEVEIPLAQ